ncbi:unnamed protein product [Closterium sp. NIES-65]|nr:unnamed protein product [Closterium sp. NIES-65]
MGGFKAATTLLVVAILIGTPPPSLPHRLPTPSPVASPHPHIAPSDVGLLLARGASAAYAATAGAGSDSTGAGTSATTTTSGRGAIARKGVPVYAERRGSDASGTTTGASETTTGGRSAASESWVTSAPTGRPAARETVPAEVRVGSVMLLGSLTQPRSVSFDFARCVSAPEIASGGATDALVWWDVFSDRTVCNAVQLFASPDCSGTAAAKHLFNGYMSPPDCSGAPAAKYPFMPYGMR